MKGSACLLAMQESIYSQFPKPSPPATTLAVAGGSPLHKSLYRAFHGR